MPLTENIKKLLQDVKKQKKMNMKHFKENYDHSNDEFIFTKPNGNLYTPSNFTHLFKRILKKNNLKEIRFHDLRHSCATLMYEAGIPLKDIQIWLGHANIMITSTVYTHLKDAAKKESAKKLDKCLNFNKVLRTY